MSPRCTFLQDLANVDPARYWGIQAQYRAEVSGVKHSFRSGVLIVAHHGGEIDRCSGEQGNGHHISQQGEWSDRADRWCFANF
jgi:hypothetical protein